MKIAGLQKLTLLDYPGKTACTVFTPGCDFRCPFCHNAELVVPAAGAGAGSNPAQGIGAPTTGARTSAEPTVASSRSMSAPAAGFPIISEDELFSFLGKRHGLLDGVCVTGGEPTLQPDLAQFCARVKREGFAVKLDTNGTRPEALRALLDARLVDMVAMDVKSAPARYAETAGLTQDAFDLLPIEESMRLLPAGNVPFEFRTTVTAELHTAADLEGIARWIAQLANDGGADPADVRWFLQSFEDGETVIAGPGTFAPWPEEELKALLPQLQRTLPHTALRGVE